MKQRIPLLILLLAATAMVAAVQAGCRMAGEGAETPAPVETIEFWEGTYTGQLKDGIPHGTGTLDWPEGGSYEGEWFEGNWHGRGTYTHPDGTVQSGRWEMCRFIEEE